jgi:hypothetical protein
LRRNCLLQWVIEGKIQARIEVAGRQGRRRRKLLDDLKERRGYSHLNEEALDRTIWTARFGRGFGPFVRQTTVVTMGVLNLSMPPICSTSRITVRLPPFPIRTGTIRCEKATFLLFSS